MRTAIFALALLMIGSAVCQSYSVVTCPGTPESLIHIDTLTITGTISAGQTVTLAVTGTIFQSVTIATAYIKAYIGGIKVFTGTEPVNMPATAGPVNISQPFTVPSQLVKGNYTANIILKDAAGNQLQCFNATLQVSVTEAVLE